MSSLHFERSDVEAITTPEWEEIIALNRAAVAATYSESFTTHPEVEATIGLRGVDAYRRQLAYRTRPKQSFEEPLITTARTDNNELVGVAYTAQNTSDESPEVRAAKLCSPLALHRWLWIGWVATSPEHQRQGVGTELVTAAIRHRHPLQPLSAYAWPSGVTGAQPPMHKALIANGFAASQEAVAMPQLLKSVDSIPTQRYQRIPKVVAAARKLRS